MNSLYLSFFSFLILFSVTAHAQWWNPFDSKTAEDCILEKINEVHTESAVRALKSACYSKYPLDFTKIKIPTIEQEQKKCNVDVDIWANSNGYFIVGGGKANKTSAVIAAITQLNYDGKNLQFQNKNDFGLIGLQIGFTQGTLCPTNIKEYTATTYCEGRVVARDSFGHFYCGNVPNEVASQGYCITGFSYGKADDKFLNNILLQSWAANNGYCK